MLLGGVPVGNDKVETGADCAFKSTLEQSENEKRCKGLEETLCKDNDTPAKPGGYRLEPSADKEDIYSHVDCQALAHVWYFVSSILGILAPAHKLTKALQNDV